MMRVLDNRIPPPILMVAIGAVMALAMLGSAAPLLPMIVRLGIAVFFVVAAGVFAFPAFAGFRTANTSIDPVRLDRASHLVTTGIYRVTRNPMYVALALLLFAWAAWLGRPLPCFGPVAFLLFVDRFQIIPEERVLAAMFRDAYTEYTRSVRRWL